MNKSDKFIEQGGTLEIVQFMEHEIIENYGLGVCRRSITAIRNQKTYVCSMCNQQFNTPEELEKHWNRVLAGEE
jgi:uncharacterized CHY-type Zn-finger protein